jgi:hypothetical protein
MTRLTHMVVNNPFPILRPIEQAAAICCRLFLPGNAKEVFPDIKRYIFLPVQIIRRPLQKPHRNPTHVVSITMGGN